MSKVTSVRLDDTVAADLDRLSTALDRPKSWLIEQAILQYIEEQSWQVEAIVDALNAYQSGQETLTPHDEVMARVEAKLRTRR